MADLKISQLTGATTPLAGTEVVPLVQSGTTKKVAVSELVKAAGQASSGTGTPASGVVHTFQESASLSTAQRLVNRNSTQAWHVAVDAAAVDDGLYALINPATGQVVLTLAPLGDATLKLGNLIQGTAAKGVNFTANTSAAGMTSQLLNWYEEGNWTATLTATTTGPTTPVTVTGTYTRIGRQVTVTCSFINVDTTGASGDMRITGLPYTVGSQDCHGTVGENSLGGGVFIGTAVSGTTYIAIRDAATTVYAPIVAGASKYLLATITYFV